MTKTRSSSLPRTRQKSPIILSKKTKVIKKNLKGKFNQVKKQSQGKIEGKATTKTTLKAKKNQKSTRELKKININGNGPLLKPKLDANTKQKSNSQRKKPKKNSSISKNQSLKQKSGSSENLRSNKKKLSKQKDILLNNRAKKGGILKIEANGKIYTTKSVKKLGCITSKRSISVNLSSVKIPKTTKKRTKSNKKKDAVFPGIIKQVEKRRIPKYIELKIQAGQLPVGQMISQPKARRVVKTKNKFQDNSIIIVAEVVERIGGEQANEQDVKIETHLLKLQEHECSSKNEQNRKLGQINRQNTEILESESEGKLLAEQEQRLLQQSVMRKLRQRTTQKRIQNSRLERIFLLDINRSPIEWKFLLMGATGGHIKTIISPYLRCSCAQQKDRSKLCRHINFIICQVAHNDQIAYLIRTKDRLSQKQYKAIDQQLASRLRTRLINKGDLLQEEGESLECLICFTEMRIQEPRFTCQGCKKKLHESCLKKWMKYKKTCPFCQISFFQQQQGDDPEIEQLADH